MKLNFQDVNVKTSRAFESENFGLGDPRVIMELLSSKIYARPRYIIVQEVASNARDANREAGRANTPIQIKLPNRIDDNLRITDFGLGITPERMSDVFLLYGNSTKRVDNNLTGGFGIGAKTPFTYTDTFTIETTTDDADGRNKRVYIAHKDADGSAKMSLISTEKVTADIQTGTTIGFAVKPEDFSAFSAAAGKICEFWDPRPVIKGCQDGWQWTKNEYSQEGNGWALANYGDPLVLIDGIPYTLRLNTVFEDRRSEEYRVLSQSAIRMFFKTGEIDITATREDLDYKPRTIEKIKEVATKCLDELRKQVSAKISTCPSLWDASIEWQRTSRSSYSRFLVEPKWNGRELLGKYLRGSQRECVDDMSPTLNRLALQLGHGKFDYINMDDYIKITVFNCVNGSITTKKTYGNRVVRDIPVEYSTYIIVDDIGKSRPNRLRLQTAFEQNKTVVNIAVITFKQTDAFLDALLEEHWSWSHIKKVYLSTIPKAINAKSKSGGGYTINAVKKLWHKPGAKSSTSAWIPDSTRGPDDDEGGTFIILKDGKPTLPDGTILDNYSIKQIQSILGITVHGILYKYRNKVSDEWENVIDVVKRHAKLLEIKSTVQDYIKYGFETIDSVLGPKLCTNLRKRIKDIEDKDLVDYLNLSLSVPKGRDDYNSLDNLCRVAQIANPCVDTKRGFAKIWEEMAKKYYILNVFQLMRYHISINIEQTEEIIFYVNAKHAKIIGESNDSDDTDD